MCLSSYLAATYLSAKLRMEHVACLAQYASKSLAFVWRTFGVTAQTTGDFFGRHGCGGAMHSCAVCADASAAMRICHMPLADVPYVLFKACALNSYD